MKNKTYRNFMIIMKRLEKVKHYPPDEAEKITHKIFDNVENDKNYGNRTAEYFFDKVISYEEFLETYK